MCRGDELSDVAEVDVREEVRQVVAVLEDVDEGRAGQRRSVRVYDDALQIWEGCSAASEEVAKVDGVEASCKLVAPLARAVEGDDESFGEREIACSR